MGKTKPARKKSPPMARTWTVALVGIHLAGACGGAVSDDVGTPDAGADAARPPLTDAGEPSQDALQDAPGNCPDAAPDSAVACSERPLVACPPFQGKPVLAGALGAIAANCYKCTGTGTCGWMTLDVDEEGCITPLGYFHTPPESFAECVRGALAWSRFDCLQDLDAGPLKVALSSCTK